MDMKKFFRKNKQKPIDPAEAQDMIDKEYQALIRRIPELKDIAHEHPAYDPELTGYFGITDTVSHEIRIGPAAIRDPEQLPGTLAEEIIHNKYGSRYHFHPQIKSEIFDLLKKAGYSDSVCKKARIWIDEPSPDKT